MMKVFTVTSADIPQICAIENECFGSEAWSESTFVSCINNEFYKCLCVKEENDICGFAVFLDAADCELMDIATRKSSRQRGVARLLLSHFFENCKVPAFLEVRRTNYPAISLYKSFGFEEIAVRKNYYQNPTEDAIIMKRELNI